MQEYSPREIDQRFALLSQYERRCVVDFLQETEEEHTEIDDVVSHLERQNQLPDERAKIAVELRHVHLPKLATADVLDFDSGSETVHYHGDELVESVLESIPENSVPSD